MGAEMRNVWRTLNPSGLSSEDKSIWFNPTDLEEDHVVGVELAIVNLENGPTTYQGAAYTGGKFGPRRHKPLQNNVLSLLVTVEVDQEDDVDVLRLTTPPPRDRTRDIAEPPAKTSPDIQLRIFTLDEALVVAREGLGRLLES